MPIDNISRIYSKYKGQIYIFDVPSIEDEEIIKSYILRIDASNNDIEIKPLTNYEDFFIDLKKSKTKRITPGSKKYYKFITGIKKYIQIYSYKRCINQIPLDEEKDEDLKTITHHYKKELTLLQNKIK